MRESPADATTLVPHQPHQATAPSPNGQPQPEADDVALDRPMPLVPEDGFGQLWRKCYTIRLEGVTVTPLAFGVALKARFGDFWPEGNRFSRSLTDAQVGDLAVSDLSMPAGGRIFAGVMIAELQPTSFTFVTLEGHTFAATIVFSAFTREHTTAAQIEIVLRASDPLFEFGLKLGGYAWEDSFWEATLEALATSFGAAGRPEREAELLDRRRKWRNASNVTRNAFIRSSLARVASPLRWLTTRLRRAGDHQ